MISSITGFLFGRTVVDDDQENNHILKSDDIKDRSDWVYVDKSELELCYETSDLFPRKVLTENGDETNEIQMENQMSCSSSPIKSNSLTLSFSDDHSDFDRLRGPYVNMLDFDSPSDNALSDISSQPEFLYNPSMEECWLVSPSPCFTAQETMPQKFESSSMENLLIEHPSMSVYHRYARRPLHSDNRQRSPARIQSEMESSLTESLFVHDKSSSLENLSFNEHLSRSTHHCHFMSSPVWTSDSESSSPISGSRSSSFHSFPVTVGGDENQELGRDLHDLPSQTIQHHQTVPTRKTQSHTQVGLSRNNLERCNKALQYHSQKKKKRYRRSCVSPSGGSTGNRKYIS